MKLRWRARFLLRAAEWLGYRSDLPPGYAPSLKFVVPVIVAVGLLSFRVAGPLLGFAPAVMIAVVIGLLVARFLFRRKSKAYTVVLFRQIPDAMSLMLRAVRAGLPIAEAIRSVSRESMSPTREEFARVFGEAALGVPVEIALQRLYFRTRLQEYAFFSVVIGLQGQTGGNLSEILENLADMVRRRVAMAGKARALAAEGRMSAAVVGALPFVIGLPDFVHQSGLHHRILHQSSRADLHCGLRRAADFRVVLYPMAHPEEHSGLMTDPVTIAAAAACIAILLMVIAAGLLARGFSERDLSRHIQRVIANNDTPAAPRTARNLILIALQQVGSFVQRTSIFSERDIAELERAARSAGYAPDTAVPMVIGGKFVLMLACPALAYFAARHLNSPWPLVCTCAGIALGMFGPNALISYARRRRTRSLQLGLSDALDLLVVCAEAGLGLESAIDRVSAEMRVANPEVAFEFAALGQDLRLTADRGAALMRMGDRAGLEGFQRLTVTLAQTLRYGTPLGQALRMLAIEMRNDRLLRLEEKAARLPTLLMIPLAIFILPCLFIVVAGPAAMRLIDMLGST